MFLIWTHSGARFFAHISTVILGDDDIYFVNSSTPAFTTVTNVRIVGTAKEAINWVNTGTPSGVN